MDRRCTASLTSWALAVLGRGSPKQTDTSRTRLVRLLARNRGAAKEKLLPHSPRR